MPWGDVVYHMDDDAMRIIIIMGMNDSDSHLEKNFQGTSEGCGLAGTSSPRLSRCRKFLKSAFYN